MDTRVFHKLSAIGLMVIAMTAASCAPPPNIGTPGDTGFPTVSGGGSTQTGGSGFAPSYNYNFSIAGTGSWNSPSVNTDSILQVQVDAGSAGNVTIPGSSFSGTYSCVSYTVTVLGKSVTTGPLATQGGECNSMDFYGTSTYGQTITNSTQTIDFSDRLVPGHGAVSVKVSNVRYDFYCEMFWSYYFYYGPYGSPYGANPTLYCPFHTVYSTHTVGGSIGIQVNGTTL